MLLPPFIPLCFPFLPTVHCSAQPSLLVYAVKEIIFLDRIVNSQVCICNISVLFSDLRWHPFPPQRAASRTAIVFACVK